jgi:DNA-binding MarR family transcriptional regulator
MIMDMPFQPFHKLMIYAGVGSKVTVHRSVNTLEKVGLIQRSRTNRGNNIYVVYRPLSKSELYSLVPDKVKELKENEEKLIKINEDDKERYQHHQQLKEQQPEIPAKQIVPKAEPKIESVKSEPEITATEPLDEDSDEYLLSIGISEEQIRKMKKLGWKS